MKRYIKSNISVSIKDLSTKAKVELAYTSDDIEILNALVKDKNARVKAALAKNPYVTEEMLLEANSLKNLSTSEKVKLAETSTDLEVLDTLATTEKSYKILCAVVDNPNTSDQILRKLLKRTETDKFMRSWQGDVTPACAIFSHLAERKHVPNDILNYLIDTTASAAVDVILRSDISSDFFYKYIRKFCTKPNTSGYIYYLLQNPNVPDDILEYIVQSGYRDSDDRRKAAKRLGLTPEELDDIELTDLTFDEFVSQH